MALDALAAHHLQLGLVTYLHMRQLGLLEEAIHPERVFIDHCHHRFTGTRVIAPVDIQVGHVAVHRGYDMGALEVQLGCCQFSLGLLVVGQRRVGDVTGIVTVFLGDHQVVHVGTALGVDLAHLPGGLARRDQRLGLVDSELIVLGVDLDQQVALLHPLVVLDRHVHHIARHVGGHVDDIGTHAAVTGPRRGHVVHPQLATDGHGSDQHQQGGDQAEELFHRRFLTSRQ